jgi:hypothetical protein
MFYVSNKVFLRRGLDRRRVRMLPRRRPCFERPAYPSVTNIPIINATIGAQRFCIQRRSPPTPNGRDNYSGSSPRGSMFGVGRRAQSDRSTRCGQQQQEECPVSFVIGSRSAAFRALHDHVPFGCTDAPVPFSAAPLQVHFKDWKSTIRHLKDWKLTIRHGNLDKRTSSRKHYTSGRWKCHRIFAPGTAVNLAGRWFGRHGVGTRIG